MVPRNLTIVFLMWSIVTVSCAGQTTSRDYWPTEEWRLGTPEERGIDGRRLEELDSYIKGSLPLLTSFLIVRDGYVVFERYYQGNKDTRRSLYCITKSFISCLLGVLIQEHQLESIDAKMIGFFPEYQGPNTTPDAREISIKHLLTMSDGLNDSYRLESAITSSLMHTPGKSFLYNERSAEILSMLITKITGMKAVDYAKKHVFEPLGISRVSWFETAVQANSADGLLLTTRDVAKLGYLYLNNGTWNGKQIIPSGWVNDSTRKQIDVPEGQGWTKGYGFYWWVRETVGYKSYIASGLGPQLVYVIPELDLLIVLTTIDSRFPGPPYLPLVDERIVPAIVK